MKRHRSFTRWRTPQAKAYRRHVSIASLVVHPVIRVDERGLGWTTSVEISTGELGVVPFLRLALSQPLYSVPPTLRIVPEVERVAALGQAFALLLFERTRGAAFSRPGLSRCTVGGFDEMEVSARPR